MRSNFTLPTERRIPKAGLIATIVVVLLLLGSWIELFDARSDSYINESIVDAGIIYAAARGINAAVSVIQSAEVAVVFASISPGEALDPINDFIERFSNVMTFSIASLALQKVLLIAAKNDIFKTIITLSGVFFILSIVLLPKYKNVALKIFIILVFIRFSLALTVMLNGAADHLFREESEKNKQTLVSFESSLSNIAESLNSEETLEQLNDTIDDLTQQLEEIDGDIVEIKGDIERQKSKVPLSKTMTTLLNPFKEEDAGMEKAKRELKELKVELEQLESTKNSLEDQMGLAVSERDCAINRSEGKSCSAWEWIRDKSGFVKAGFAKVAISSADTFESIITLLALMVLRSVLLPILFWIVLYKGIRNFWNNRFYVMNE